MRPKYSKCQRVSDIIIMQISWFIFLIIFLRENPVWRVLSCLCLFCFRWRISAKTRTHKKPLKCQLAFRTTESSYNLIEFSLFFFRYYVTMSFFDNLNNIRRHSRLSSLWIKEIMPCFRCSSFNVQCGQWRSNDLTSVVQLQMWKILFSVAALRNRCCANDPYWLKKNTLFH